MDGMSMRAGAGTGAYRLGVATALLASFLIVWVTIVHDDGQGLAFFLVILAAGVGGFAAWFRAAGLARTMLGVAVMQALLGIGIATAPVTANTPDGVFQALAFGGFFTGMWLVSAVCFWVAAKGE